MMTDEQRQQLKQLEDEVRQCTRCPLCEARTHAVPGEGPIDAAIFFVGEGPGAQEDRTGRPFVGNAGQLLESLLERIGLLREDVYITNVVKCRPPNNRDPQPSEIESCEPYLERQLALVDPEIIVTLGRFAMEHWLPGKRITRVHGQGFRNGRRLLVPMFHPAAALHQEKWRPALEEDFDRLPRLIDAVRLMREDKPIPDDITIHTVGNPDEPAAEQLGLFG